MDLAIRVAVCPKLCLKRMSWQTISHCPKAPLLGPPQWKSWLVRHALSGKSSAVNQELTIAFNLDVIGNTMLQLSASEFHQRTLQFHLMLKSRAERECMSRTIAVAAV